MSVIRTKARIDPKYLTVGCDPEVFFIKDGKPFPVTGLVGGTKDAPRKLACGAVLEDNIMAEIHIEPATDSSTFSNRLEQMLKELNGIAENSGCQVSVEPYARFEDKYLLSAAAQEIGCEADYDAYALMRNQPYNAGSFGNYRFAGGHIHIGFSGINASPNHRAMLVKWLDALISMPMYAKCGPTDRNKNYGLPGRYRPKIYGIEYRTPDNQWLKSGERMRWIWKQVSRSVLNVQDMRPPHIDPDTVNRLLANPFDKDGQKSAMQYMDYARIPEFPDA